MVVTLNRAFATSCLIPHKRAYRKTDRGYPVAIDDHPFRRNLPRPGKKFRKQLHKVFSRDKVICGIVGMEKPDAHWLCFVKRKKRLIVFDSAPPGYGGMRRIRLEDLHVSANGKSKLVLNPRELIVFRET